MAKVILTVVEDVEYLGSTILRNAGEQLPVAARGNADDDRRMSAVVFHEFYALVLFLPKLDVTID
jgi:hypothetical protein